MHFGNVPEIVGDILQRAKQLGSLELGDKQLTVTSRQLQRLYRLAGCPFRETRRP